MDLDELLSAIDEVAAARDRGEISPEQAEEVARRLTSALLPSSPPSYPVTHSRDGLAEAGGGEDAAAINQLAQRFPVTTPFAPPSAPGASSGHERLAGHA